MYCNIYEQHVRLARSDWKWQNKWYKQMHTHTRYIVNNTKAIGFTCLLLIQVHTFSLALSLCLFFTVVKLFASIAYSYSAKNRFSPIHIKITHKLEPAKGNRILYSCWLRLSERCAYVIWRLMRMTWHCKDLSFFQLSYKCLCHSIGAHNIVFLSNRIGGVRVYLIYQIKISVIEIILHTFTLPYTV